MKTKIAVTLISIFLTGVALYLAIQSNNKGNENSYVVKKHLADTIVSNPGQVDTIDRDTTITMYFEDLSYTYNYKIIDIYPYMSPKGLYDSNVVRTIFIYDKKGKLLQEIKPTLYIFPWYFIDTSLTGLTSRSYITGKNKNTDAPDNYCGELVIADLNFDGLEDFATAVEVGMNNGTHYAFYIQNSKKEFKFNEFLTEELIWFPDKINNTLKTLTTAVPSTQCLHYHTLKYYSKSKKWKTIEDYGLGFDGKKIKSY